MLAFFGLFLIALGGFASGSFYVPIKFVKKWSWESIWTIYSISALLLMPIIAAFYFMPTFVTALQQVDNSIILATMGFGAMWGIGGLSFGLSMRYLGVGLGCAVAMGFCSAFGTLTPLMFEKGHLAEIMFIVPFTTFMSNFASNGGMVVFAGILLSLIGIGINGYAGFLKEKDDMVAKSNEPQSSSNKDFSLSKGLFIAFLAGLCSAGFAFAVEKGAPIGDISTKLAVEQGIWNETFAGLFRDNSIYIVLLCGGFLVNFLWCLFLMMKNGTLKDFSNSTKNIALRNTGLGLLAGILWYLQFFLLGMGKYYLGEKFAFASWSIFMALVIVFSVLWGLATKEWKNASKKTLSVLWIGVAILILSGCMMSMGGFFDAPPIP